MGRMFEQEKNILLVHFPIVIPNIQNLIIYYESKFIQAHGSGGLMSYDWATVAWEGFLL